MIINQIRIRVYKDIFTLDISTKYENFIDTTILLPTRRFFGTIIDVDYWYHAFTFIKSTLVQTYSKLHT